MKKKKKIVRVATRAFFTVAFGVSIIGGMAASYYLGHKKGRSEVHIKVKPIYLERQVIVPRCTTSQMADLLNAGAASCRAYLQ